MSTALLSPTRSSPRPTTPVDQDLQELYNEVWASFASEEPPATSDRELDNIYSVYGGDGENPPSPATNSPVTPTSAVSSTRGELPGPQRNTNGRGSIRRLPPTPTGSSSQSSIYMPEPDPYYDSSSSSSNPPSLSYSDSFTSSSTLTNGSTDLLRKATAGSMNSRRLPAPPPTQGRGRGLPSDPRPASRTMQQDSVRDSNLSRSSSSSYVAAYTNRTSADLPRAPSPAVAPSVASSLGVPRNLPHRPSRDYLSEQYLSPSSTVSLSSYADAPSTLERHTSGSSFNNDDMVNTPQSSYNAPAVTTYVGMPQPDPYLQNRSDSYDDYYTYNDAGPSGVVRRPSDMLRDIANYNHGGPSEPLHHEETVAEYWEDEEDMLDEEESFVNFSLLSHLAVLLRDKVPRGTHVKGSIPYPRAFTGKDIVSTIQSQIQRELAINHSISTSDRRAALQVARSLQSQLFFYEVEWGGRVLQDGVEDVYMFLDDQESGSADAIREELPTGVVTMLTKCYAPTCVDGSPCYAYACPRRGNTFLGPAGVFEAPEPSKKGSWITTVPKEVLGSLPESEINRQTIIHKIISKEDQYIQDLDIVESVFIKPLRGANPPIISPPSKLEDFIDDVFGNILDLRECNRRLLEVMYVRQREQAYVIQRIGDVFLAAATEFRLAYPIYIGHHSLAEKRMKDEIDENPEFRLFLEHCSRQSARQGESPRLDLKHFLNRPSEHLQKYPVLLDAIYHETAVGNPDADYLQEAIEAIKNLQTVAQLRTFQTAMGRGPPGKWEWHDLVSKDIRATMTKDECKRQSIIFELIKGEMAYVKDLENIENMYIEPLRAANPPIISPDRLEQFIKDVFHNFAELHVHHRRLVETFHEIQREQHPTIRSITAAMFDAALNFRDAYMEYIPNYPIAAYRIDDEMNNNPAFKTLVEQAVRHPDAHRLDMKNFINRPIPRLLRYELLLKGILDETPPGHDDKKEIPQVLEVIKSLGKDTEPGVVSAKQKVELWKYNSNLVFKQGESIDLDLLDEHRSLIHQGKLLRQPDSGLEWNGWSELYVLLFDNYMVMTKPKEKDGVTKYHVNRRPIPLDLLTLVNFTDPGTQRGTGLLRTLRGGERGGDRHTDGSSMMTSNSVISPESATDSRSVYPCTLHHNGRLGGPYILYAESASSRSEWKQKLEEALGIRKVVQESNKVFEIETLSADTFLVPSLLQGATSPPAWNQENSFTGKVTCSVPFNTADGRGLVAIGCAEGVWIGFRHDPKSMRRVLHLKLVTQCAMLEEFGVFLVLADKSLFAYHIEALVPSSQHTAPASQVPQKLNGTKDVHFFSVGTLHGRTLIIYMKKKGLDSIFRVLEPVGDRINERVRAPAGLGSRLGFRSARSEWFRIYRDFFLPSESFDLVFLKAKIAILCTKGFEIMDLNDFKSVTIPQRDDPRLAQLAKRCEACRPMGMFRSREDEFLLCYDEFGVYVDKHGDPSRSAGTIEWEGTADRVALHSPYVLLFDSRFIEIRHLDTGRLAQIIPGNDVRCLWDGRGLSSNNVTAAPGQDNQDEMMVQEAQVHAVMNAPDGNSRMPSRAVAQHVFELIPTVPLYLPGSLSSPPPATHVQTYSPPQSPLTRDSLSWRS